MEQRHHMPTFHLPAESESSLPHERPVGPLRQESFPGHVGDKSVASSPVDKLNPVGAEVVNQLELMEPYKLMDQKTSFGEHKLLGQQRHANLPPTAWRADQDPAEQHDSFSKPLALFPHVRKGHLSAIHYENGLFSSSLPDIFDKKLRLTSQNGLVGQPVEKELNNVDDEPFELTQEIEAQVIGNLLPNDDDLLSGVLDNVGYPACANNRDDMDDDIFYTGGGMELETDDNNNKLLKLNSIASNGQTGLNGILSGENPYGEHPSRTLFIRNIDGIVEDSELELLFQKYGEIQTLYTACKHHGFVMVSYYDIRSAETAMKALQSKPFRNWKLDIHYSVPKENTLEKDNNQGTLAVFNLDPSVTNDDLRHIFGGYGKIKEIHETSQQGHHKYIEFYDVRAAEAALYVLNRSDIAGKTIKLVPCCVGDTKRLMQHRPPGLEPEDFGVCKPGNATSPLTNYYGSVNMASTGPEHGISRVVRTRVQPPINQFRERNFLDIPSITPQSQSMSSPVRIATAGTHKNHSALGEHGHSLGRMNGHLNYGYQGMGAFHPHSLPEFDNSQSNCIPYNLSTIPPIGVKSNSRTADGIDSRHLYKVCSANLSGHSSGHSEALGVSRTGSCPLHGHQVAWNNSNNSHHHTSSPMLWPNSGPFINNIPSCPPTQVHGISRASRMLENALPMNHHVGSAPAVNPSIWDRRHGYAGERMEVPSFHPGSAGSRGFPGSPHLHQLELSSMFPQSRGNPAMSPAHIGARSPQQRGHMFHGRSHIGPLPSSFDSPVERTRSRRNESCANQSDSKRQYELDIERIACGEDSRTTLMIKNIPNKYTSKMLLTAIDENHRGTYDFIYLPIDFKNKCNVGYAFINMITPEHIVPFYKIFHGKRWEKFNSEKVASLAYARIQGKSALIAHFQNSSLMNEDKRCRPILFHSHGPNAGDQEPFPLGTHIRSRPGRSRILSCEDSLSTSANSWTPSNGSRHTSGYPKEADPTTA
ncbi:hypothetical protein BRADI_5g08580v3 [Brachypodium distachyon]|uniref:RRM domain-containing protein n=1 Tax=Brachypodium distachyon TaxID=15368 RepID=A0A0Q3GNI1_BRADI|nr:hypothetical protein BRADI_5g08580v3 [Brachypodium distachyon]